MKAWRPLDGSEPEVTNLARRAERHELVAMSSEQLRILRWVQSQAQVVSLDGTGYDGPTNTTAVVTHAGRDFLDYIDSATMLALTLQRYLPEVPRFAIVIKGMDHKYTTQLREVGWHLVEVEDWGKDHCGADCGSGFLGRWGDSFEKLNVWRFPFERVLFLDSDTYVLSSEIRNILDVELGPNQIAMTPDGCKPEHNSGMLLFRPDLGAFTRLMSEIALHSGGREVLDQTVINLEYKDNIVTLDKKYNCIDYSVDWRCPLSCGNDTVIAHFTGAPKPTRQSVWNLERVRALNGSDACIHTNRGCCGFWSMYFCDMKKSQAHLSARLGKALNETGPCLVPGMADAAENDLAQTAAEDTGITVEERRRRKAEEEEEAVAREEQADAVAFERRYRESEQQRAAAGGGSPQRPVGLNEHARAPRLRDLDVASSAGDSASSLESPADSASGSAPALGAASAAADLASEGAAVGFAPAPASASQGTAAPRGHPGTLRGLLGRLRHAASWR